MLLDHRTYTVRAGTLRKQMALYEKHGLAVQKRHFGEPLAWLVARPATSIPTSTSGSTRTPKTATASAPRMYADPEWQAYIEKNAEADT